MVPNRMVSVRFRALANTLLVVGGALLIGQSLHLTVVTGQQELLAPAALGRVALGVALVVAGRIVHNPVEEARDRYRRREAEGGAGGGGDTDGEGHGDADGNAEFDPELSPLGAGREDRDDRGR